VKEQLGAMALIVGALSIALALFLGAPLFGPSSWLSTAPLAAGALLVVAGALLALRSGVKVRGAGRLVLEAALVCAAVVGVQAAALQMPMAADVSSNHTNTLSEKSVSVSRALTAPVQVHAAMRRDDRAFVELTTLIERYQHETAQISLVRDDALPSLGEPNVVVVAGERTAPLRFLAGAAEQEELITNALVSVTSGAAQRAYFLAGHGEADLVDDGPDGLSRWREALAVEGVQAVPLPLSRTGIIPRDAAAVVIAGPTSALAPDEVKLVRDHLDAGGRALFLLEPAVSAGLDGVIGAFGIQLADGAIVDASPLSGLAGGADVATGSQLEHAHPITRPLGDALTHFASARALVENPGPTAKVTALVRTGAEARAGDVAGPLVIAMAAEDAVPTTLDGKAAHARLVVVGDASFATNRGLGFGANKDLAVNVALWLVEREDKIEVRPRGRGGSLLLLTPTGRERLAFALLYLLPLALVAAGLGARAWRRR
jgi:ABC-type uncharacterized transport system involved in gliding motility auxiliary subunit